MTPIDPIFTESAGPRTSMAPPYVDDDMNIELVQQGLDVAENETRDAVADAYEASARLSDDPLASLDDIDYLEGEDESTLPELAAMHEDLIPDDLRK